MIQQWEGVERNYLLSFHKHSGLRTISCLFFIHILASSPAVHFRPFVFNNILGYTFIFTTIFRLIDSLHIELITDLISNTWFLGKGRNTSTFPPLIALFSSTFWVPSRLSGACCPPLERNQPAPSRKQASKLGAKGPTVSEFPHHSSWASFIPSGHHRGAPPSAPSLHFKANTEPRGSVNRILHLFPAARKEFYKMRSYFPTGRKAWFTGFRFFNSPIALAPRPAPPKKYRNSGTTGSIRRTGMTCNFSNVRKLLYAQVDSRVSMFCEINGLAKSSLAPSLPTHRRRSFANALASVNMMVFVGLVNRLDDKRSGAWRRKE